MGVFFFLFEARKETLFCACGDGANTREAAVGAWKRATVLVDCVRGTGGLARGCRARPWRRPTPSHTVRDRNALTSRGRFPPSPLYRRGTT